VELVHLHSDLGEPGNVASWEQLNEGELVGESPVGAWSVGESKVNSREAPVSEKRTDVSTGGTGAALKLWMTRGYLSTS
jgi:hypothetical protein